MRHAGAASAAAADIAVVRRTIGAVVAESRRRMAVIGGIALRFPSASVSRNVVVIALRIAESTARCVVFRIRANSGIWLIERKFALTGGHCTICAVTAGSIEPATLSAICCVLKRPSLPLIRRAATASAEGRVTVRSAE